MLRTITLNMLFIACCCASAYAQNAGRDGIDHGPTGTANLDYFNPTNDAHMKWLINDIETHHLKPAVASFAAGDLQKAKVDLDYLLARLVNHPQALAFAGLFAKATKNSLWGINNYERALRLYPQYALTHAQYGKYLSDIDRVGDGIERLKKALEMDPRLVAAQVWLAAAYLKSGNADLARQAAEQARSLGFKGDLTQYGLN